MEDFRNFVVMYGKNSGTCNVHAAKVLQTAGNKVAEMTLYSHMQTSFSIIEALHELYESSIASMGTVFGPEKGL